MLILNQALQRETYWQAFLTFTRRGGESSVSQPGPFAWIGDCGGGGGEGNKTGVRKSSLFVAGIEPRSTSRYSNECVFC